MKKVFLIFAWICFSSSIFAAGQTNGFLVIEIDRFVWSTSSNLTQHFKIPLTDEFLSNFKHGPSRQSMGTGFMCRGGSLKAKIDSTSFIWWIHRTADNRWAVNMWGRGTEDVNGHELAMGNPSCSQDVVINKLDDLWMRYMLSFSSHPHEGLNVSFTAKFETAKEMESEKPMSIPPVKKADGSMLFIGDDQSSQAVNIECQFQEN
jgi:hypothetical protein